MPPVKENKCKEKRIYGWCVSRKKNTDVAWRVVGKPGHAAYTTTPDHNIQSIAQDMTQVLRAGEHLRHAKGSDGCSPDWWVQFYVPPMPTLDRCSVSSNGKRIIGVREESRVRERDFENLLSSRREDEGYKGNT
ncbi:Phosphoglycerate mutase-like protein AT74 [Glycine soja]